METRVLDDEEKLPFILQLLVGPRGKEEVIPIQHVCLSNIYAGNCIYSIQELKPIKIQLITDETITLLFSWNKTYRVYSNEEEERCYSLSNKESLVTIYEHGKTDYVYPWRFGIYHFEIQWGTKRFYGGIRIEPKNVDWEQFQWMLSFMNEYVNSIFLDTKFRKNTPSILSNQKKQKILHTIDHYLKHEKQFFKTLKKVINERHWTMEKEYEWNSVSKKRDGKSIVKEQKSRTKFYNRRMYRKKGIPFYPELMQILQNVQRFYDDLQHIFDKIEKQIDIVGGKIKKINTYYHSVKNNIAITDRDKMKYRQLTQVYQIEVDRLRIEREQVIQITSALKGFYQYLLLLLKNEEKEEQKGNYSKSEKQLLRIIHEMIHPKKKKLEVELKPTYLLYEYFIFFSSINVLMDLGFQVEGASVEEQLQATILNDDLLDGSKVTLKKGEHVFQVVFNELIDGNYDQTQWRKGKLFSGEESKKPDVRLDYYIEDEQGQAFKWSILLEVKYSPLFNIYQQLGNTKAMEQMYKYWSIKYVHEENGRKKYVRNPIKEVICVYPGGYHYRMIEDGCGIFLQMYPQKDGAGAHTIIGSNELKNILIKVLKMTE
ncbi:MAG: hypothetical protein ACI35O_12005 [Bacillaceae bacterium]